MEPVLKIFQTIDELDEDGVPKQTKAELMNFSKHVTEYCINYVNEPSVGLWHIQNHIHNKIIPKNNDVKSKLLQTLQDSREIGLELDSVGRYVPSPDKKNNCDKILSETLDICKNVNKMYNKIIEQKQELMIKNKTVDDVIVESVANEANGKDGTTRARANSFEAWYKNQFKS
eukprot:g12708.t1